MGDTKFRQTGRRTRQGPYRTQTQERKRQEAEQRNAAWRSLTRELQVSVLHSRPGASKKQIERIGVQ